MCRKCAEWDMAKRLATGLLGLPGDWFETPKKKVTTVAYIGRGRWGSKLLAVFKDLGATTLCQLGRGDDMTRANRADLVVFAVPPDAQSAILADERNVFNRVLLSKPVLDFRHVEEPAYVDLWRTWCPGWVRFRNEWQRRPHDVTLCFGGQGPDREFSAKLDWGPHALAWLYDLDPGAMAGPVNRVSGEGRNGVWETKARARRKRVTLTFGNRQRCRYAVANDGGFVYRSTPEDEAEGLRAFCRDVLADAPAARATLDTMRVVMADLGP